MICVYSRRSQEVVVVEKKAEKAPPTAQVMPPSRSGDANQAVNTRKLEVASVVKRLLQEHYTARRIDKEQFKAGAKHLTDEILRRRLETLSDVETHAERLVRCYMADIDPLYGT